MGFLNDKTVIVTGAGRGLGREIALSAASEGANVVVNDLGASLSSLDSEADPAAEVVAEIEALGGKAIADRHSIAEWESARAIVQTAMDRFGGLDGVVNNAGILRDKIFHKMEPADFDAVVQVHLKGYFYVSRAAADIFRGQRSGAYVHMTSSSGLVGNMGQANYAAAKLGVAGLSRSIAIDMAAFGVRSNCVAPWAFTRMTGSIPDHAPGQQDRLRRMAKLGPDKVAPLVTALLDTESEVITGQIFGARGGEIYLFNQPRPIKTAQSARGFTSEAIRDQVLPGMVPGFTPLESSPDFFSWEPI